jgi:transposase-like protein
VVSHTTIMRWVIRYVPEFEKRWSRFSQSVGCSWRVDETYIAIKGNWHYLYRVVDKHGRTVDFPITARSQNRSGASVLSKGHSITHVSHQPAGKTS